MGNLNLKQDMHVHSTFSDGKNSVEENLHCAQQRGLQQLTCVDHVRKDSTWMPGLIKKIKSLSQQSSIQLLTGVEAKILNEDGDLDLPSHKDLAGIDYIYAADHMFPLDNQCYAPHQILSALKAKELSQEQVIQALVRASLGVLKKYPKVILAHLFSILPKIKLSEDLVPDQDLAALATQAKKSQAKIEINERWQCPSLRSLSFFKKEGVPILVSTDSHRSEDIGRYHYVSSTADQLKRL